MTPPQNQTEASPAADFTRTWRYKVGLFLIIVGHLGILVGVLGSFVGLGAATIGTLVVGGEVVALTSIVFLGKEGFVAIKNKAVAAAKSSYTAPVGRTRHRIGIALLLTNVVTTYLMVLYAWDAFAATTPEGPAAAVWGLDLTQQGDLVFGLFLTGEIAFLIAIYVLGANWWGKFRRLFVWEAPAR